MNPFFVSNRLMGAFLTIAFLAFLIHKPILEAIDDYSTPQPWFTVNFKVPDHVEGEDPIVVYQADIKRALYGEWVTGIYRKNDKGRLSYKCMGTGNTYYDENEHITLDMPLSVFIHDKCKLPPNQYKACAVYKLEDNRGIERTFGPYCSDFVVYKKIKDL